MANNGGRQGGGGGNGQMNEHVEFTVKVRLIPTKPMLLRRTCTESTFVMSLNTLHLFDDRLS